MNFSQLARYVIGLSWIYHGIFPKIIQVAPLELAMTASLGFSAEHTHLITKAAGVGEVLFGITFIVFYRHPLLQWLNILGLSSLLIFVAVMTPFVLVEAFNPITTNIPLIALSIYLLQNEKLNAAKKMHNEITLLQQE